MSIMRLCRTARQITSYSTPSVVALLLVLSCSINLFRFTSSLNSEPVESRELEHDFLNVFSPSHSHGPAKWALNPLLASSLDKVSTKNFNSSCTAPGFTKGFFSHEDGRRSLLAQWNASQTQDSTLDLLHVGRNLLSAAVKLNQTLLTLQVGGMDGKRGDPMYKMMRPLSETPALQHWMPVVAEPVAGSFDMLVETYSGWKKQGVPCPLLWKRAITYPVISELGLGDAGTVNSREMDSLCGFCHFNLSNPDCQDKPGWMKHEINSLDCAGKRKIFGEQCTAQDWVDCGTIGKGLERWGLAHGFTRNSSEVSIAPISILQIDVEGFEIELIPGVIKELEQKDVLLPLVINFESKILARRKQLKQLLAFLQARGYTVFPRNVDTLAILLNE